MLRGIAVGLGLAAAAAKVEKTHFDDNVRFLFVAGLEGTGHHTLQRLLGDEAFRDTVATSNALRYAIFPGCMGLEHLTGLSVMGEELQAEQPNLRGAAVMDASVIHAAGTSLRQRQASFREDLAATAANVEGRKIVLMNGFRGESDKGITQISYPNCGIMHKALHHPDLVDMAEAAETAGVDLRVLVMTRSARDILTSTVLHRGFADAAYASAYLADNAAALAAQLQLLDRRFFTCIDQASLLRTTGSESAHAELIREVTAFLHPSLSVEAVTSTTANMGSMMSPRDESKAMGAAADTAGANAFVAHLNRYTQLLDQVCQG